MSSELLTATIGALLNLTIEAVGNGTSLCCNPFLETKSEVMPCVMQLVSYDMISESRKSGYA